MSAGTINLAKLFVHRILAECGMILKTERRHGREYESVHPEPEAEVAKAGE